MDSEQSSLLGRRDCGLVTDQGIEETAVETRRNNGQ
jgi:hypothetical protein